LRLSIESVIHSHVSEVILPPAGFTLGLPTPVVAVPLVLSHQAMVIDPAAPEGFYLTQATNITIN
jgi:hypothetical protein